MSAKMFSYVLLLPLTFSQDLAKTWPRFYVLKISNSSYWISSKKRTSLCTMTFGFYGRPLKTTFQKYPIAAIGYLQKKDPFVHLDYWISLSYAPLLLDKFNLCTLTIG